MNSVADIWSSVLRQLKRDLSETTINTWFDELEAVDFQDSKLYLHCTNDFKSRYVKDLFSKNIQDALRDLFSTDVGVEILDDDALIAFSGGETAQK